MISKKVLLALPLFFVVVYGSSEVPTFSEAARTARLIINKVDWAVVSTISTVPAIAGYPFANIVSLSDGPIGNGSGVPYILLNDLDFTGRDTQVDRRITLMVTLAEKGFCENIGYEAQDPRCSKLFITGKVVKITEKDSEYKIAEDALVQRHPIITYWKKVHNFYFSKVDIDLIMVMFKFGGPVTLTKQEYFNLDKI